jgi:hypothetical protein
MRFLVLIKVDENSGQQPDQRLLDEMGKLIGEMQNAKVLVETDGLRPTAEAARIRTTRGKISVTDGPFTEAKEIVGGYFILDTTTQAEAVAWMTRFLEAHGTDWTVECEVRQMGGYTAEDVRTAQR